jgi:hypothetical protein
MELARDHNKQVAEANGSYQQARQSQASPFKFLYLREHRDSQPGPSVPRRRHPSGSIAALGPFEARTSVQLDVIRDAIRHQLALHARAVEEANPLEPGPHDRHLARYVCAGESEWSPLFAAGVLDMLGSGYGQDRNSPAVQARHDALRAHPERRPSFDRVNQQAWRMSEAGEPLAKVDALWAELEARWREEDERLAEKGIDADDLTIQIV